MPSENEEQKIDNDADKETNISGELPPQAEPPKQDSGAVRPELRIIFRRFVPQVFGLMTLQLNLLIASIIAWLFSGGAGVPIDWLNGVMTYPLRQGAAAAIYYSERLFEFPQGLIGLSMATAIYPLLTRHAIQKNRKALGDELTLGLRLQLVFAIPAGVGLMMMSENLSHLLFQRGAFSASDMFRTADMIFWFGSGVWAFCALPLLVRAFYILGDTRTPFRIACWCSLVNTFLSLFLMCWMKENGLALAVSVSAALQAGYLVIRFQRRYGHIQLRTLFVSVFRSVIATGCMAFAVAVVMESLPGNSSFDDILHIGFGGVIGVSVFLFVLRFLGGRELGIIVRGRVKKNKE
ncbi:hypothetical protein FACS189454_09770 [Planctomycetales bacterium]|nr:hypothetical protein FACS189454_09770 [Planctomycetales bacterium]